MAPIRDPVDDDKAQPPSAPIAHDTKRGSGSMADLSTPPDAQSEKKDANTDVGEIVEKPDPDHR